MLNSIFALILVVVDQQWLCGAIYWQTVENSLVHVHLLHKALSTSKELHTYDPLTVDTLPKS